MSKLKPCPFCGHKLKMKFPELSRMSDVEYVISHYCQTIRRSGGCPGVTIDVYGVTRQEAIDNWNRRIADV